MNRPALRFEAVLRQLDEIFHEASVATEVKDQRVLLSYLVFKIHDQWNFRSRQIVLIGYGKSEKRMIKFLRSHWSPRKIMDAGWEPDWHIPTNTIRAGRLLNIPKLGQLQGALGAVTTVDDIRWTRNAIVHNIPAAFNKYHAMTLSKYLVFKTEPALLPLETNPQTGHSIYEDWCSDLLSALRIAL